jgi:hypothetical protein
MPNSTGSRIVLFLVLGCMVIWLTLCPGFLSASLRQDLGIKSKSGQFIPKVHVFKDDSSILVIKKNSREKFDSLKIRFTFPGVNKKGAMDSMYIQWGKGPRQMGRLHPVNKSKSYHQPTKTFETKWTASKAFRIVNRDKNRAFGSSTWNQVVHLWLDGKRLTMARSPISPAPKPDLKQKQTSNARKQSVARSPENKPRRQVDTPSLGPVKNNSLSPTQDVPKGKSSSGNLSESPNQSKLVYSQNSGHSAMVRSTPNPDRTKLYALQKKYDTLAKKYVLLEKELADTQRWYYFGPLLALIFSLLFTGVSIFASHILLSRGRRLRALSPRQISPVASRSQGRYRTAG